MVANQGLQNIRKFRFFGPIEKARVKPKKARDKAKESTIHFSRQFLMKKLENLLANGQCILPAFRK